MIRAPSIRISGTLLLAAAVTGACDAGAERSGADVRFDTVGAVLHVTSGSRPEWNEGEAWTVPDSGTTIGALEGPPELVFGEVSGVAVDTAGRIWVADEQAKELRVFGPDGAFIRRVGREGEGPGEFRNLSGLVPAPGGIAALDGQLARVTVFAGDGSVLRSFRIQRPYMIFEHGAAIAFDRAGRFFDRAHLSTHPPVDTIGVITYSAAGDPVDTAVVGVVEQNHLTIERNGT